jgi:glycine dehydrogenase subunit 2
MLVEPTETESKATLDQFIATVKVLVAQAKAGDADFFRDAPRLAPRRRLDETLAARHPVLRWSQPAADETESKSPSSELAAE